jgi:hypothetical protein
MARERVRAPPPQPRLLSLVLLHLILSEPQSCVGPSDRAKLTRDCGGGGASLRLTVNHPNRSQERTVVYLSPEEERKDNARKRKERMRVMRAKDRALDAGTSCGAKLRLLVGLARMGHLYLPACRLSCCGVVDAQSEMKRASCRRWASRKTIPTQRSTSLPCPKTSTRAIASSKRLPECTRSRFPPRRSHRLAYASSTRPVLTLRTRFPCYVQSQLPVWSGGVCPHRTARPRQEFPYRSPLRSHRHTRAIGSGTASSFTPFGCFTLGRSGG